MNAVTTSPSCGCGAPCEPVPVPSLPGSPPSFRGESLSRALRLEYFTVGWNTLEGVVAVTAAVMAGSVALLGFGIDSFVECASAGVMIWRLQAEKRGLLSAEHLETLEHRARRGVAISLFLLAVFVSLDAFHTLMGSSERPAFSPLGTLLLVVSMGVMLWLAWAKRGLARELGSEALEADAFQTTACWWLSLAALVGIGLNGALGWWWADPLAALAIAALVAREGWDAWKGKACC